MPEGWEKNHLMLRELAGWCLAQQAAEVTPVPIIRLQANMLEARIASSLGDHEDAVALMEVIAEAVPNNTTVNGLLESFRKLAAESQ
jgi:hypothetical protein